MGLVDRLLLWADWCHCRVSTCHKWWACLVRRTRQCSLPCRLSSLLWSLKGYVSYFPRSTGWKGGFVTAPHKVPWSVSPWDGRKYAQIYRALWQRGYKCFWEESCVQRGGCCGMLKRRQLIIFTKLQRRALFVGNI